MLEKRWYVSDVELDSEDGSWLLVYWQELDEKFPVNFRFEIQYGQYLPKVEVGSIYISNEMLKFDIFEKLVQMANLI